MRINAVIVSRAVGGQRGLEAGLGWSCYLWTLQQVAGDPHGNADAAAAT